MMTCMLCASDAVHFFCELHQSRYFQCAHCALIFLDPSMRLSVEDEKTKYDQHQNSPLDQGYRDFLQPAVDQICEMVRPEARGLDFGAGPGPTLSVMLSERGIACVNFDPIYHPDTTLLDQRYDFIVLTEVMEHLFDPIKELSKISSMLSPKGVVVIKTLFFDDPSTFAGSHYHRDPTHVAFYAKEVFRWLANRFGCEVAFPRKDLAVLSSFE